MTKLESGLNLDLNQRKLLIAVCLVLASTFHICAVSADELKVLATSAIEPALNEIKPNFEKASGDRLAIDYGVTPALAKRLSEGEAADIVISTREGIENLIRGGKVIADSEAIIGRGLISLGIRKGMPKPDISSEAALIKTLIESKGISYSNPEQGGFSGVYVAKVIETRGLSETLKPKTRFAAAGGNPAQLLISEEVEVAINIKSELLSVEGVEVVGPLPGDFQKPLVIAAAIPLTCKNPERAKNLINFFHAPDSASAMAKKGLEGL